MTRLTATITTIAIVVSVLLTEISYTRAQEPPEAIDKSQDTIIDGPPAPLPPAVVSRNETGQVTLRAIPLTESINLDGRLDEQIYQTVSSVTDFFQQEPNEGQPASEKTEVWVMFDSDNVYVSARCWDSNPERIIANEMRRDSYNLMGGDQFTVVLDTFYDRRNGYAFLINPIGGMFDAQVNDERDINPDWNTVWEAKASRFENGWTLEMLLPFKSLRYRGGTKQTWGINFERIVKSKNETEHLTRIPASLGMLGIFKMSSAATLVGIRVPSRKIRLELKPYAISDVTTDLRETPSLSNQPGADFGLDVKYGVTKSLTADLTYNTDFAQVEVDEQQVNLTRFSLFYPEKREFFLEGQGIFEFGGGDRWSPNSYYTSGGEYDRTTPILFFSRRIGLNNNRPVPIDVGGRLTGRVGKYSIGTLNIQTEDEPVSGTMPTNFSVVRVKRDILRRSSIGAIYTGRSVSAYGNGSNQVYGVDGIFSFYDNLNINTYLARTQTPGMSGNDLSYRAQLDYGGDRYGVQVQRMVVGKNFNPEIGFLRRADMQQSFVSARFSPRPQSLKTIRKFWWETSLDYIEDGSGQLETRTTKAKFGIELESGDLFRVSYNGRYEFLKQDFYITDDVAIPVDAYSFQNMHVAYFLGQQRAVSGTLLAEHGSFFGGKKTGFGYRIARVAMSPQVSLEPNVMFQWVDLPQGNFTTTLISTRATYTLTPRMYIAALFQYNSNDDAVSNNFRLRWEYRPGSELFVVYSDERLTTDRFTDRLRYPELESRSFVVKINRLLRF